MEKEILTKLFHGEVYPSEQYIPRSEEYKRSRKAYKNRYDELESALKKTDLQLLRKLDNVTEEYTRMLTYESEEMFLDGFCLGVRMMAEVCQNKTIENMN